MIPGRLRLSFDLAQKSTLDNSLRNNGQMRLRGCSIFLLEVKIISKICKRCIHKTTLQKITTGQSVNYIDKDEKRLKTNQQ